MEKTKPIGRVRLSEFQEYIKSGRYCSVILNTIVSVASNQTTMASNYPTQPLKALSKLLEILGLCGNNITIGKWQIASITSTIVYSSIMLLYIYHAAQYCARFNFSINKVSGSLCLLVGIFQMFAISICLRIKRIWIVDSLAVLQETVGEREYIDKFPLKNFSKLSPNHTGCEMIKDIKFVFVYLHQ